MAKKYNQNSTYKKRLEIKHSISQLSFEAKQIKYLKHFIRKNKKALFLVFSFIFVQVLLEIALLIWGKSYIHKLVVLLDRKVIFTALISLSLVLIFYVLISYFSIKASKQFLVDFINNLRENWFKKYLEKTSKQTNSSKKIRLLTKITYHFSLIQMGFSQTVSGIIYLSITLLILIAALPTFAAGMMKLIPVFMLLYLILIFAGYYISHKYISKEQTLSTAIISHVAESIYDIDLIKKYNWKQSSFNKLQELVELDTYFRVRRSVWMALGRKILFTLIILIFALMQVTKLYFPELMFFGESTDIISSGIILIILTRLSYISLNIGLYLAPLKIGLILSVPEEKQNLEKVRILDFETINFHAKKAKLSKDGKYYKKLNFDFKKGERILFTSRSNKERTNLAKIFIAEDAIHTSSWVIKTDKERFLYSQWRKSTKSRYIIEQDFQTISTIGEIISAENKFDLNSEKIEEVLEKISKIKEYKFIFELNKKLGTTFNTQNFDLIEIGLLQIAHCLITKPRLIVIDGIWSIIDNEKINKMMKILESELKDSLIITFDKNTNKNMKYTQIIDLNDSEIKILKNTATNE